MNFRFPFGRKNKNHKPRTSRTPCRRRPAFDTLESRVMLAADSLVLGTVFRDLDTNAVHDASESGLAGRTVYADVNNNSQLDPGEISTTTGGDGSYVLDLPPGQYAIRAVPMPHETATAPAADCHDVTVFDGFGSGGRDFGVLFVTPLEPVPQPDAPALNAAVGNSAYVQDLYRNILGRNADAQGLNLWLGVLNAGVPRNLVAAAIWNSPEHRALQVESYYRSILHRPSDAAGKAIWVNAMVSGAGEVGALHGFLTSAEYSQRHATDAAFVAALYHDLLGRAPDAAGQAIWLQALRQGVNRRNVADGFLFSTESIDRLVQSYYSAYLDRAAEPQGLATWTSAVQSRAQTTAQAGQNILASEENFRQGLGDGGSGETTEITFPLVPMPTQDNKAAIWVEKGNPNNVVFNSPEVLQLNRTVTIYNNDKNAIFPFFRAANSRPLFDSLDNPNEEYRAYVGYQKTVNGNPVGYLGLLPGEHITVKIPMVFWDSGRIYYTTDPRYLVNNLPKGNIINNPFQYYATDTQGQQTRRYIDDGTKADTTIVSDPNYEQPPAVFYYHATVAEGVSNAAPAGFVELAIKDPAQATINNPGPDPSILGPLVSYDVSFVDTLSLPGAAQAPAANVPQSAPGYAPVQKAIGWVGAPDSLPTFQMFLGRFTGHEPGNPLGNFFGGQTWPQYYVSPVTSGPSIIQVPATKNIFEQSPLRDVESPFHDGDNNSVTHYIMATGGVVYRKATNSIKGDGVIVASDLSKITNVDPDVIAKLAKGMTILNTGTVTFPPYTAIQSLGTNSIQLSGPANQPANGAFIFVGSQFAGADYSGTTDGQAKTLTLQKPSALLNLLPDMLVTGPGITGVVRIASLSDGVIQLATQAGATVASGQGSYVFQGGLRDYAAQGLLNLWYAWSDYYVSYVASQNPFVGTIQGGTIGSSNRARITFPADAQTQGKLAGLYVGMGVTTMAAPGLLPGGTVIASFGTPENPNDRTIVNLSKYASKAIVGSSFTGDFGFALPTQIDRTEVLVSRDPSANPDKLSFAADATADDKARANAFASVVYAVMKAFSGIPGNVGNGGVFDSLTFMQNIIGGNIAQIPGIGEEIPGVDNIASPVALVIRDQSKSLERGVADFNAVPQYDWYANPATPTGNLLTGGKAGFNAYSLDPFVWFVHEYLGVSGYAFSLDDDAANPNVTGARALEVSIGGITNFKNKAEWSPGAEFGPVPSVFTTPTVTGTLDATGGKITNLTLEAFNYLAALARGANNGALVVGPGISLAPGVQALARIGGNVNPAVDPANQTVRLVGGQLVNGSGAYVFFGPVHVTGTINAQTNRQRISNINADELGVLKAIAAILPLPLPKVLLVSGPGIKPGTTIQGFGDDNSIILDDAHPLDPNFQGVFRFTII